MENYQLMQEQNIQESIQIELDPLLLKKMAFLGIMQKIFGVFGIIGGAISCIFIITAVFGVPIIIAGVKLFQSGKAFSWAVSQRDGAFIRNAIINLANYWLFTLIGFAIFIGFYIILLFTAASMLSSQGYYY